MGVRCAARMEGAGSVWGLLKGGGQFVFKLMFCGLGSGD